MIDKIIATAGEWLSVGLKWAPMWVAVGLLARDCRRDTEEVKQSLKQIRDEANTTRIEMGIASQHLKHIQEMLRRKLEPDEWDAAPLTAPP